MVYENSVQTARRLIEERLKLADVKISIKADSKEAFEESEMSPSYPGVETVYRKEILECVVDVAQTSQDILKRVFADGTKGDHKTQDSAGITRTYEWMDEKTCQGLKVKFKAP